MQLIHLALMEPVVSSTQSLWEFIGERLEQHRQHC